MLVLYASLVALDPSLSIANSWTVPDYYTELCRRLIARIPSLFMPQFDPLLLI